MKRSKKRIVLYKRNCYPNIEVLSNILPSNSCNICLCAMLTGTSHAHIHRKSITQSCSETVSYTAQRVCLSNCVRKVCLETFIRGDMTQVTLTESQEFVHYGGLTCKIQLHVSLHALYGISNYTLFCGHKENLP